MENRLVLSTDAGAVLVASDRKCIVNTVDTENQGGEGFGDFTYLQTQ